jgi:E3 ubiquitin-protein ligase HECTD1
MADADPEMLLDWLTLAQGEESRDIQLVALEQLCMLLLMADNVDKCFESCPPRAFIPALCKIFMDAEAPDNILEVTARALTYYLDVSVDCTRRITAVDGALKAIIGRMQAADMQSRASKDLAEQCVKVLELACARESDKVYDAGALPAATSLLIHHASSLHRDTVQSCMNMVTRLVPRVEPKDSALEDCVASLSQLLQNSEPHISDPTLKCFMMLADRFIRRGRDPAPIAENGLLPELIGRLKSLNVGGGGPSSSASSTSGPIGTTPERPSGHTVTTIVSLLSTLCRGSPTITNSLLDSDLPSALESALRGDERTALDVMRLVELLLVLIMEGRKALPKTSHLAGIPRKLDSFSGDRNHRQVIEAIRSSNNDEFFEAMESGFDVNFMDDVGQTLLNWAAAFGSFEMVEYLLEHGADVNRGVKSSSLHYAACFGRPNIVKLLLQYGADPELRDEDGHTPLEKAQERGDEWHRQVIEILENPSEYMLHDGSDSEDSFTDDGEGEEGSAVPTSLNCCCSTEPTPS